jgi:hypothetical protein
MSAGWESLFDSAVRGYAYRSFGLNGPGYSRRNDTLNMLVSPLPADTACGQGLERNKKAPRAGEVASRRPRKRTPGKLFAIRVRRSLTHRTQELKQGLCQA